ncbi:MAG: diadenylate cyclase CdaA [Acutalibacteraceae bacterium]
MWDFLNTVYNWAVALMLTFKVTDVIDILVVAFIIYNLIKIIRETRAEQLIKGIFIVVIAFLLATILNLKMLSSLFTTFFQFAVLAVFIIFQPEIRRALEQIGRSKIGKYWHFFYNNENNDEDSVKQYKECIYAVCKAADEFQKSKTGALIVFERQTKLGDIIDTGTIINAKPSAPMLGNIFFNKAPMHDGALVIRNGMLYAAGCYLPLTKDNSNVSLELGTRHRAAIGISENSDAVTVVVSEETGTISLTLNGKITRNYTRETLNSTLEELLIPQTPEKTERISILTNKIRGNKKDGKEDSEK